MKILVERIEFSPKSTIGRMSVDGVFECFTLEDVVRDGPKVMHQTAIPAGTYKVVVTMSSRFQRELPLLVDVPGFEGIRIHPGNTAEDTSGCLLVGMTKGTDFVGGSRLAFNPLFDKIKAAFVAEDEIGITVR